MMSDWISVDSAPTGQENKIQLWHKVHKCAISGHINSALPHVIEMTKTHMWPIEAFTHWQPLLQPPEKGLK